MNKLLEARNKAKAKKPKFERQDTNIFKQFRGQYRKPKGMHSKMRRGLRGHKRTPAVGYSSPRAVKGLTRQGIRPVVVVNMAELLQIKKDEGVILSSTLGLKKRLVLLEKIKELKLSVLNIKNVDEYVNKAKEIFENKKKEHKGKKEERKKHKEEAAKKAEEKENKDKTKTENKTEDTKKVDVEKQTKLVNEEPVKEVKSKRVKQEGKVNEPKK